MEYHDESQLAALPPDERFRYEQSLKHYRDSIACLEGAKQEGIEIGAHERAIEIAELLNKLGMDLKEIARITRLSEDEIKNGIS